MGKMMAAEEKLEKIRDMVDNLEDFADNQFENCGICLPGLYEAFMRVLKSKEGGQEDLSA